MQEGRDPNVEGLNDEVLNESDGESTGESSEQENQEEEVQESTEMTPERKQELFEIIDRGEEGRDEALLEIGKVTIKEYQKMKEKRGDLTKDMNKNLPELKTLQKKIDNLDKKFNFEKASDKLKEYDIENEKEVNKSEKIYKKIGEVVKRENNIIDNKYNSLGSFVEDCRLKIEEGELNESEIQDVMKAVKGAEERQEEINIARGEKGFLGIFDFSRREKIFENIRKQEGERQRVVDEGGEHERKELKNEEGEVVGEKEVFVPFDETLEQAEKEMEKGLKKDKERVERKIAGLGFPVSFYDIVHAGGKTLAFLWRGILKWAGKEDISKIDPFKFEGESKDNKKK